MNRPGHCRCCGVGVEGMRAKVRVCVGCDDCDELHGDVLQGILMKAVADGRLNPYAALARALIDDAQLTGRCVYRVCGQGENGQPIVDLEVPNPPPRWLVVCGRAVAQGQQPDMHSVVGAVLGRYIGWRNSSSVLVELKREMLEALMFIDNSIFDVEVTAKTDAIDPGHLVINIQAKTPTIGAVVTAGADDLIPADIMTRKRAEA